MKLTESVKQVCKTRLHTIWENDTISITMLTKFSDKYLMVLVFLSHFQWNFGMPISDHVKNMSRANNSVEGFHKAIQSSVMNMHPSIWKTDTFFQCRKKLAISFVNFHVSLCLLLKRALNPPSFFVILFFMADWPTTNQFCSEMLAAKVSLAKLPGTSGQCSPKKQKQGDCGCWQI